MLELNFHPFPTLETNRLLLRRILEKDLVTLNKLRQDILVLRYLDRHPHHTLDETKEMLNKIDYGIDNNEAIAWAITLKGSPELIGTVSYHRIEKNNFRAEIGYMLNPQYWRKGITSEAVKSVIDYGFQSMKLHSIEANINPANEASAGLLKKFGFIKEAYFRENYYFNGNFLDTEIYSLLRRQTD